MFSPELRILFFSLISSCQNSCSRSLKDVFVRMKNEHIIYLSIAGQVDQCQPALPLRAGGRAALSEQCRDFISDMELSTTGPTKCLSDSQAINYHHLSLIHSSLSLSCRGTGRAEGTWGNIGMIPYSLCSERCLRLCWLQWL